MPWYSFSGSHAESHLLLAWLVNNQVKPDSVGVCALRGL